jgi:hypothetical protein
VLFRTLPSGNGTLPVKHFPRRRLERSLRIGPTRITPGSLNVLVLDYCDVKYLGKKERGINTWRANWNIWQAHGFERPAWDSAVQFRTRILDRNQFGPETGFEAVFRFDVGKDADLSSLEVAIECPEFYQVLVNNKKIDFRKAARWIDPHILSASIDRAVRYGHNEVRIVACPFDVRMELENIYIRGNFSLEAAKSGFQIVPQITLLVGPWSRQGFPYYSELVSYDTAVSLPPTDKRIMLQFPSWKGGSATVEVDGKRVGFIAWMPFELDVTEFLSPGKHDIRVTVAGVPKNLFGPFHDPARSRNTAWPTMWSRFPEHGPPPGEKYDVEAYGLFNPVRLLLRDSKAM